MTDERCHINVLLARIRDLVCTAEESFQGGKKMDVVEAVALANEPRCTDCGVLLPSPWNYCPCGEGGSQCRAKGEARSVAIPEVCKRVQEPTIGVGPPHGPETHEEARWFHQGFLAGLTVYARESGQSTLKRDNALLRRLCDEQGWKTIEEYERLAVKPVVCEHGVTDGDWCQRCNQAMKDAIRNAQESEEDK